MDSPDGLGIPLGCHGVLRWVKARKHGEDEKPGVQEGRISKTLWLEEIVLRHLEMRQTRT